MNTKKFFILGVAVLLLLVGCSAQSKDASVFSKKETSTESSKEVSPEKTESSKEESSVDIESSKEESEDSSIIQLANDFSKGTTDEEFYELVYKIPKNWEKSEDNDSGKTNVSYRPEMGLIYLDAMEPIADITSATNRSDYMTGFSQGFEDYKLISDEDCSIGGFDGFRFSFTATASNTKITGDTLVFCTTGYLYSIVTATYGDQSSYYENDYRAFIDSISVIEIEPDTSSAEVSDKDESTDSNVSKEYQNALKSAQQYSDAFHMSKKDIYDQLISEYGDHFEEDAAQYAVDNINADFFKNALLSAESYNESLHMSKRELYDQLTSEYGAQFTEEEAQYAIDNLVADYKENALLSAQSYNETLHMSKQGLYDQLVSEYGSQFTEEEAQYAIDNLKADYKENALLSAKSYQDNLGMSKAEIYDQLISEYGEKFTEDEAQYAIDHLED